MEARGKGGEEGKERRGKSEEEREEEEGEEKEEWKEEEKKRRRRRKKEEERRKRRKEKHLMGLSSTTSCCTQAPSCDAPQTHNVVSSLEEGEHVGDNGSHSRREQEGACCPFQSCNSVSCSIHSGVAPATVHVASLKSGNMHDTD